MSDTEVKALAVIAWSMPSFTVETTVTPLANRDSAPRNAAWSTGFSTGPAYVSRLMRHSADSGEQVLFETGCSDGPWFTLRQAVVLGTPRDRSHVHPHREEVPVRSDLGGVRSHRGE